MYTEYYNTVYKLFNVPCLLVVGMKYIENVESIFFELNVMTVR